MIIYISAAKTLVDHIELDETLEAPNTCPECGHSLWKHGKRERFCEGLQICARLEIQRLFCKRCRKTFSLMPTFLEAGMHFERLVAEIHVSTFTEDESTYRAVAWSEDDEREDASASVSRVFRSVSRALERIAENILSLHQQTLESLRLHNPTSIKENNSTSLASAKSHSKQQQLKLLMLLLFQLRTRFCNDKRVICEAYRSLCLGFPLPTPHCVQQPLF
jgi:Domain of unknown function (DUF6431)